MAKSARGTSGLDPTFEAANNAFQALKDLSESDLAMAVAMLSHRLGVQITPATGGADSSLGAPASPGGQPGKRGSQLSAKDFMKGKTTAKEIERVAAYAYYLVHYKDVPEFKAKDISAIRTEARGPAFTNLRVHMDNATKAGLLTAVGSGKKGITSRGEAVVDALPNREAVSAALAAHPLRRRGRKKAKRAKPS